MHANHNLLADYRVAETYEAAGETAGVQLEIDHFDAHMAHLLGEPGPGWSIALTRAVVIYEPDDLAATVKSNVRQMRLALQRLERRLKSR